MSWSALLPSAVGFVLLAAGISKIGAKESIQPLLTALGVPAGAVRVAAYAVPTAEILCGMALLVLDHPAGGYAALGLSGAFLATLVAARRRGVAVGCRCFGALDSTKLTPVAVARAAAMCLMSSALVVAAYADPAGADRRWPDRLPVDLAGLAVAAFFVISFTLLTKTYELFSDSGTGVGRR